MYGYIYKTTNLINKKVYIGKNKGKFNKSYLGSGIYLQKAIKKYGKENFSVQIICILPSLQQINEFEKFLISKYREILGKDKVYNISNGGDGGAMPPEISKLAGEKRIGRKVSQETKLKLSKALKGKPSWIKGKKWPEEHKKILSKNMKGRKLGNHTKESYIKGGQSNKKVWENPEYRKYMSDIHKRQKPSIETIEKARQRFLGNKLRLGKEPWNKNIPMKEESKKKLINNEEYPKKISTTIKNMWQNPEYRKRNLDSQAKKKNSLEYKENCRQARLKYWRNKKHLSLHL